ncbi:hypothetical protein EMCRGX_G023951 [Ephydatia muelleri]
MEKFGKKIREELFLLDEETTFTNHGSYGAIPKPVFEAHQDLLRSVERNVNKWFLTDLQIRYGDAIKVLAGLTGSSPSDVAFVENATTAVNAVLRSQSLGPGDGVLVTNLTYAACTNAAQVVCSDTGASLRSLEVRLPVSSKEALVQLYRKELEAHPTTKIVLVDHISSPISIVMPVKEIVQVCHEKGVRVIVDGAHAPGQLALNMAEIGADYYTGNLHKWMFCPRGCAFLYVSPSLQAQTRPLVISHDHLKSFSEAFRMQATRDYTPYCMLPAAVEFVNNIGGLEAISSYNRELSIWASDMLCKRWNVEPLPIAPELRSPFLAIVGLPKCFGPPTTEVRRGIARELLASFNVSTVVGIFDEKLWFRISTQVYNTKEDYAGAAALVAEAHKLHSNGPKCQELDWVLHSIGSGDYGCWCKEALNTISRLASHLAIHQLSPKTSVVAEIYGQLNMTLICSIARTILTRELPSS